MGIFMEENRRKFLSFDAQVPVAARRYPQDIGNLSAA
jgi:hypothetical protein